MISALTTGSLLCRHAAYLVERAYLAVAPAELTTPAYTGAIVQGPVGCTVCALQRSAPASQFMSFV